MPTQSTHARQKGQVDNQCKGCPTVFQTYASRKRDFCSHSCAARFNNPKTVLAERPCPICGKPFTPPTTHAKQKYCSVPCGDIGKRRQVWTVCMYCGLEFTKAQSFRAKYCSPECYHASVSEEPLEIRFWRKVARVDDAVSCWEWTATRLPQGYGIMGTAEQMWRAHRLAWRFASGRDPAPDEDILHTCDNPGCVRNDGPEGVYIVAGISYRRFGHLWLGNQKANSDDMYEKGRARPQGVRQPPRV